MNLLKLEARVGTDDENINTEMLSRLLSLLSIVCLEGDSMKVRLR